MKPTLLDFNKLEFMVICGDYQGFKGHGAKGNGYLFVGLGVSLFLGDFVYALLTKILFYVALGFYLSSSAVIMLFLSRK